MTCYFNPKITHIKLIFHCPDLKILILKAKKFNLARPKPK